MHQATYLDKITENGFVIVPPIIYNCTINDIINALNKVRLGDVTRVRRDQVYA